MRAAEEAAIAAGTPVEELMERAGKAAAEAIWRFAGPLPALVLCGPGNNGGDGYVIARELAARGVAVRVAALGEPRTPAARAACESWAGPVETLAEAAPATMLIDALFGTGLGRPLDVEVSESLGRLAAAGAGARRGRPAERRGDGRRRDPLAGAGLRPHHHLPDAEARASAAARRAAHGPARVADIGIDAASQLAGDRPAEACRRPARTHTNSRAGW